MLLNKFTDNYFVELFKVKLTKIITYYLQKLKSSREKSMKSSRLKKLLVEVTNSFTGKTGQQRNAQ